jgi:hypothetical protein
VGPFGLGDWAFDNYMVNLSIVISAPSLGIKIGVGTSGNCEDCAVGRFQFAAGILGFVAEVVAVGWAQS